MNLKTYIKVIFGITLLVILLSIIGIENVINSLYKMNPIPLIFAAVLIPVNLGLRFLRWDKITKILVKIPTLDVLKIYMIGFFFSAITPSKIGDVVRFRYIKKYGASTGESLSLTIMDRMFDIFIIFIVTIVGILLIPEINTVLPVWQSLSLIAGLLVIVSYLMLKKNLSLRILNFFVKKTKITKKIEKKPDDLVHDIYKPVNFIKKKPKTLFIAVLSSLFIWMTLAYQSTLIFASLGLDVNYFYVFVFTCIAAIVGLIPITISGIGTRDATFIILFSIMGITANDVIVMSLFTLFLTQIIPAIIGGIIYILYKK